MSLLFAGLAPCQRFSVSVGGRLMAAPTTSSTAAVRFFCKKAEPPKTFVEKTSEAPPASRSLLKGLFPMAETSAEEEDPLERSFSYFLGSLDSNSNKEVDAPNTITRLVNKHFPRSNLSKMRPNPTQEFFQFQNRLNKPIDRAIHFSSLPVDCSPSVPPSDRFFEIPASPPLQTHISMLPVLRYLDIVSSNDQTVSPSPSRSFSSPSPSPSMTTDGPTEANVVSHEMSSIMKKRRKKMNKHKYRKRLKALRFLRRQERG